MPRRGAALIVLTALWATVVALAPSASAGCWSWKRSEKRAFNLINKARVSRDLGAVRLDKHLGRVARKHTKEMIEAKSLHHTSTVVLANRVTNWVTLGENVGRGSGPLHLHRGFMDSPTHRANVLYAAYNHVGIGSFRHGGKLWTTVVFEARTDPGTTLAMRC